MKIATAAYPLEVLPDWDSYVTKISTWVAEAAGQGAELLVFPEYGAMELATLSGLDVAADLEAAMQAVSERIPAADAVHADLAQRHGLHILAASGPVFDADVSSRPVNRARFFAPSGRVQPIDKQIMTRAERDMLDMVAGAPLQILETALGRIGVLICYDGEFPLLGRMLAEADVLLVPSCTEALSGYWRVRIGAMARALENQCVSVMASLVGEAPWNDFVDTSTGTGGVFGPPDVGFPPTGVIAEGQMNAPGWTYARVDLAATAHVRADGTVLNRRHWAEQPIDAPAAPIIDLR